MKKSLFLVFLATNTLGVGHSQINNDHDQTVPPEPIDQIIQIAGSNDTSGIRDFSSLNFEDYSNVETFDLIRHQDPSQFLSAPVGDTIDGEFPDSLFTFEGFQFSIEGSFKLIPLEISNLILQTDTLANVQRFQLTENYALISNGDSVATYSNTYYSFYNKSNNQLVFEVFSKKRYLKGGIYYPFNGISYSVDPISISSTINLNAIPNPSDEETTVHFELWHSGLVTISVSNQNGTVNQVVYDGNAVVGANDLTIQTQQFTAGTYILTVTFEGFQYSTNLIIL